MAREAFLPASVSDQHSIVPDDAEDSSIASASRDAAITVSPEGRGQVPSTVVYQPTTIVNHHQTAIVTQQSVNLYQPIIPVMIAAPKGPSFLVRAVWYLFIGWWLSVVVIVLGYICLLTVVGIPAAFALFNRIPQALTLRPRSTNYEATYQNGILMLQEATIQQRPWIFRALYFVVIGWWFGAVWLILAWVIGLLVITLPISFLMYNRTSGIMTLQRH